MVQYAEIKEVETLITNLSNRIYFSTAKDRDDAIYHLKKYKDILEGWYGDEQYHIEKDLEL